MTNFEQFLKRNSLKKKDIALFLSVSSAFITQLCEGRRRIPAEKLNQIKANKDWDTSMLMNEDGKRMDNSFNSYLIPVLPVSARGGSLADYSMAVSPRDCEYAISPIAGADMIIPVNGESMAPEYPNGCTIVVKKINDRAFIEWGKVYVLDTINGAVIKEIHKSDKENELICVSLNPDPKYAPFSVRREDVLGVYRVLMCMALK